ncbi:MAG: hypothetical protein C0599_11890 [Salinivirgaceae bacterium]|nr:MAG: hypothetical protein C0599_11890 [Salinivirgaceae bacterium]
MGFIVISASAQQEAGKSSYLTYQRIEVGYLFGGQMYNNTFTYNPGVNFQGAYGFKLSKRVYSGLGLGFHSLENERFIPLFAEVIGKTNKKDNSPVIRMQMGYAHAWYNGYDDIAGFDFKGGAYFSAGYGLQLQVNAMYYATFFLSYVHQFGQIEFESYSESSYQQQLNYDMLSLTLSLTRKESSKHVEN